MVRMTLKTFVLPVLLCLALMGCPTGGDTGGKPTITSFTSNATVLGGGGGTVNLSWDVKGAEYLISVERKLRLAHQTRSNPIASPTRSRS
jgi:hypothetical protein